MEIANAVTQYEPMTYDESEDIRQITNETNSYYAARRQSYVYGVLGLSYQLLDLMKRMV